MAFVFSPQMDCKHNDTKSELNEHSDIIFYVDGFYTFGLHQTQNAIFFIFQLKKVIKHQGCVLCRSNKNLTEEGLTF